MKKQITILLICLSVVAISGCFFKGEKETSNPVVIDDPDQQIEYYDYKKLANSEQVIINDIAGNVVVINEQKAAKEVAQYLNRLYRSEQAGPYTYSVAMWHNNETYVVQLGQNGVKVNEQSYRYEEEENALKVLTVVENLLVANYWDSIVDVDRIYVNADDIVRTISANDHDITTIVELIKESTYLPDAKQYAPLFPNYDLELSIGGKAQVEVKLLNPQFLGVTIVEKQFIYEVSPELWEIIDKQMPIPSYVEKDLFYLFQSSRLFISDQNKTWEFDTEDYYLHGKRDAIIRELLVALPTDEPFTDEKVKLTFTVGKKETVVYMNEQGFAYEGQNYRSDDVYKRIINIVEK